MKLILSARLSLLSAVCNAQSNFGRISGTVEDDDSGASIPGAAVTATNAATGAKRQAASDSSGSFVFPALEAGTYDIRVESRFARTVLGGWEISGVTTAQSGFHSPS